MAESTLSLGYPELRSEVGYYLGYGTDSTLWDSGQAAEILRCVKEGLSRFYMANPFWSFLHPNTTLTFVAGTYNYTLPDDFGGLEGDLTYAASTGYASITEVGEGVIREKRAGNVGSGYPYLCAVRPLASTGSDGQRSEIIFWPVPSAVLVVTYRYTALPGVISATYPYPLGGMMHARTIRQSCIAAAEELINDMPNGPMNVALIPLMEKSLALDKKNSGPQNFGDFGDRRRRNGNMNDNSLHNTFAVTTYDGVTPT